MNFLLRCEQFRDGFLPEDVRQFQRVLLGVQRRAGRRGFARRFRLDFLLFVDVRQRQEMNDFRIEMSVGRQIVEQHVSNAFDAIAMVEVKTFGEQQKSYVAMVENVSRQQNLFLRRIFAQRQIVELSMFFVLHVISQANEVEVGREINHRVIVGRRVETRQNILDEMIETRQRLVQRNSLEELFEFRHRSNRSVRRKLRLE